MPSIVLSKVGSSVKISCISVGKSQWLKKIGTEVIPIPNKFNANYYLRLENIKEEDSGTYYCNGKKQNNVSFWAHADVYIGG